MTQTSERRTVKSQRIQEVRGALMNVAQPADKPALPMWKNRGNDDSVALQIFEYKSKSNALLL